MDAVGGVAIEGCYDDSGNGGQALPLEGTVFGQYSEMGLDGYSHFLPGGHSLIYLGGMTCDSNEVLSFQLDGVGNILRSPDVRGSMAARIDLHGMLPCDPSQTGRFVGGQLLSRGGNFVPVGVEVQRGLYGRATEVGYVECTPSVGSVIPSCTLKYSDDVSYTVVIVGDNGDLDPNASYLLYVTEKRSPGQSNCGYFKAVVPGRDYSLGAKMIDKGTKGASRYLTGTLIPTGGKYDAAVEEELAPMSTWGTMGNIDPPRPRVISFQCCRAPALGGRYLTDPWHLWIYVHGVDVLTISNTLSKPPCGRSVPCHQ